MATPTVGNLELTVLLSVVRLGGEAYGLAIRRDVAERTGRDHSVGAIYTTLERLQGKGLLTSRGTAPTPTRGGRSRRLFSVTGVGQRTIREAEQVARSVWAGVGQSLKPRGA